MVLCLHLLGESQLAGVRVGALPMSRGGATKKKLALGSDTPAHCPPAHRRAQGQPGWGPCLLRYVEGVAVGLGVEPAAAEGLSQDGVVGLLDPLQAMNKEPHVRKWGGPGPLVCEWTKGQCGLPGPCLRPVLSTSGLQGEHETPPPGHTLHWVEPTQSLLKAPSGF